MPFSNSGEPISSSVIPARASPSIMAAAVFEISSIRSLIRVRIASLDWAERIKPMRPVTRTTTADRMMTEVIVRLRLFFLRNICSTSVI